MSLRVVKTDVVDILRPVEMVEKITATPEDALLAAAAAAVPDAIAAARTLIKSKDTPAAIKVDCIKLIFDAAKPKAAAGMKAATPQTAPTGPTPWEDIVTAVRALAPQTPPVPQKRRHRRAEAESA